MAKAVVVQRHLYKDDYPYLPHDISGGTILYRFVGPTQGFISPEGVAVTEEDDDTSHVFEIPLDAIIPPAEEFAQHSTVNEVLMDNPDTVEEAAPELDQFQGFGGGSGGGGGAEGDWGRNDDQGGDNAGDGDDQEEEADEDQDTNYDPD